MDIDVIKKAVKAEPYNWDLRRVLADLLEEGGYPEDQIFFQRWMAEWKPVARTVQWRSREHGDGFVYRWPFEVQRYVRILRKERGLDFPFSIQQAEDQLSMAVWLNHCRTEDIDRVAFAEWCKNNVLVYEADFQLWMIDNPGILICDGDQWHVRPGKWGRVHIKNGTQHYTKEGAENFIKDRRHAAYTRGSTVARFAQ